MTCGIYIIKNKVNGKVYVGQSINIELRWTKHKSLLKHGKHWNVYLQNSWNKHSEDNFEFSVILVVDNQDLLSKHEQEQIDILSANNREFGFNNTDGGEGGRQSEDVRKVMSEKAKGRQGYWKGKSIPEDARKNMSEAAKNRGCCKPTVPVIHLETGVKYKSCSEAARILFPDIPAAVDIIYKVARGMKKSYRKTTWIFETEYGRA